MRLDLVGHAGDDVSQPGPWRIEHGLPAGRRHHRVGRSARQSRSRPEASAWTLSNGVIDGNRRSHHAGGRDCPKLRATSKKQALQELAKRAAESPACMNGPSSTCCWSASAWAPPASATASPFPHGKLAELQNAARPVRAAGYADRFRFGRRSAGRSGFPAAGAGRRRRRSSEGAGAGVAPAARPHGLREAARRRQRRCDLCAADGSAHQPRRLIDLELSGR